MRGTEGEGEGEVLLLNKIVIFNALTWLVPVEVARPAVVEVVGAVAGAAGQQKQVSSSSRKWRQQVRGGQETFFKF